VQEGQRALQNLGHFKDRKRSDIDTNFKNTAFKKCNYFKDSYFYVNKGNSHINSKNVNTRSNKNVNSAHKRSSSVVDVIKNDKIYNHNNMYKHKNVCSVSDIQGLEGASVKQGDPLPQYQDRKRPECAQGDNHFKKSLENSGFVCSTGSGCDAATQVLNISLGEGQSVEHGAEDQSSIGAHSLGNWGQSEWEPQNKVLPPNNESESREGGVSQLVSGGNFYMQEWDLENLNSDLDDPGGENIMGQMPQRLGTEQSTNVPNFGFLPLHYNEITQGPVNQQITAQQLWGKKTVKKVELHNYRVIQL
jgi:hypothetical protein